MEGEKVSGSTGREGDFITYSVTVGVVKGLQLDDIRMAHNPHNLELTILQDHQYLSGSHFSRLIRPYLEPLVLEDSLNGSILAAGGHLGLENHTKGSIAHDLALSVGDLFVLASKAILDLFTNNLCSGERRANVSWRGDEVQRN